ncbi:MAG: dihydrofolate reductase family protein [Leptospira sp.]|nr:dihydrofolate reductase family protein [Leptospira sp.]
MIEYLGYIATSLDGKIAKTDGELDWLLNPKFNLDDEDFGYKTFFDSIDCLVMGKNTFLKVLEFPEYPYGEKIVWILSKSKITIPTNLQSYVKQHTCSISELDEILKKDGKTKRVYVDGGRVISSYAKLGFLKKITITTIPVLIGKGISLWDLNVEETIHLNCEASQLYTNGFLKQTYSFSNNLSN